MMKEFRPFIPILFLLTMVLIGGVILTNGLDPRNSHLAGHNFEAIIGNRRIGTVGLYSGVTGPGFGEVQRARPARYTSETFERDNAEEVLTDGWTELSFWDTPVAIGTGGFEYDLEFRIPKWGERTPDASSTHDKSLTNTIYASGVAGNLLVIDMDLQPCDQYVQVTPAVPPTFSHASDPSASITSVSMRFSTSCA